MHAGNNNNQFFTALEFYINVFRITRNIIAAAV